jgi:glycosyltransferase involved in cell wall biosynthesis
VYPTGSILGQADLFIFPSLVEPQGLALLEAFAAGVPVVASRTGGIVEMLEDGEHGILVQPGDPDALADAIVALLADPSRGEAYVRSARRRVEDFDIHRIAGQYESLYSELIPLSATAHGEPQR